MFENPSNSIIAKRKRAVKYAPGRAVLPPRKASPARQTRRIYSARMRNGNP